MTGLPGLHFLKSFQLTPELLFFVFLPALIFESACNMKLRDMTENLRLISWLAMASLLVSALFAAVGIEVCLGLIGFEVPFIVTLIFGALMSATDPVAVLALFLIVLAVAVKGYGGAVTIVEGALMFLTMVAGGFVFGLLMGLLFANLIGWVRENEHVEIKRVRNCSSPQGQGVMVRGKCEPLRGSPELPASRAVDRSRRPCGGAASPKKTGATAT